MGNGEITIDAFNMHELGPDVQREWDAYCSAVERTYAAKALAENAQQREDDQWQRLLRTVTRVAAQSSDKCADGD